MEIDKVYLDDIYADISFTNTSGRFNLDVEFQGSAEIEERGNCGSRPPIWEVGNRIDYEACRVVQGVLRDIDADFNGEARVVIDLAVRDASQTSIPYFTTSNSLENIDIDIDLAFGSGILNNILGLVLNFLFDFLLEFIVFDLINLQINLFSEIVNVLLNLNLLFY